MLSRAVFFAILLFLAQSGASNRATQPRNSSTDLEFQRIRQSADALDRDARYERAASLALEGFSRAQKVGSARWAARFSNQAGAAQLASFQYLPALDSFQKARTLATRANDLELAAAISVNIASLHLQTGDLMPASEEAQKALEYLKSAPQSKYQAPAIALAAKIESAYRGLDAALPYYSAALRRADLDGNARLRARLLSQLGFEYLSKGRLDEAETAMVEAFRQRRLADDPELAQSYRGLGMLRMAQGDLKSAAVLLDRALEETRRRPGRVPLWATLYARGQLAAARGNRRTALREFREALEDAERWHLRAASPQAGRPGADAGIREVCASFIDASAGLYFETGQRRLAREAFDAAGRCRAAESGVTANERDRAVFAFHLGEPYSLRWTLAASRLTLHRIAGRRTLDQLAGNFRRAVAGASAEDAASAGESLLKALFAKVPRDALRKVRWSIAADDALAEIPFSALPDGSRRRHYLVEQHSIQIISGPGREREAKQGFRFIGLADPVYNTADPRMKRDRDARPALQLPRLAGSAAEVRLCAAAWGDRHPMLLEGIEASRGRLAAALEGAPAVVHLATHVVRTHALPGRALIALSLSGGGEPSLLDPAEIARWRFSSAPLVTLSGCASGAQDPNPAPYSLGLGPNDAHGAAHMQAALAQAWLSAGARAVAASLWQTPDDTGEFFAGFYHHLRETGEADAAGALRAAQLDAMRSPTWRSSPKYWAAYFVIARG